MDLGTVVENDEIFNGIGLGIINGDFEDCLSKSMKVQ